MTALVVISVVVTALCVGYHFGRRTGSTRTWKKRASRTTLGRLAMSLIVLMVARRVQRSFLAERALSKAATVWGLKFIEPLQFLRASLPRQRFH
jgi:hypothetical protein